MPLKERTCTACGVSLASGDEYYSIDNKFWANQPNRCMPHQVKVEAVDHPAHYGGADNVYEVIKVIEAWQLDFCTGNAVKYLSRAGKKDPTKTIEDLKKSIWYIERRIQQLGASK
jgi:hypothetical protein